MGLYDRPYYRDERGNEWLSGRSMVANLILLNVGVYLAQFLFDGRDARLTEALGLHDDLLSKPWQIYQLLTYGFVHDPQSILHVAFNMFGVWLFGRDLEGIYGRAEFTRFYLAAIFVAGAIWFGVQLASGQPGLLIGASGGVMGLMILFVLHFPRRVFYIYGILPLPAWGLAILWALADVTGFLFPSGNQVANTAHLAGMGFGLIYYQTGMNLGRLIPTRLSDLKSVVRLRPRLKIHDPERDQRNLNARVDEILAKISRQGEASLTRSERRTLEEASKRYQQRRQ
jgi:rhomboid family protein